MIAELLINAGASINSKNSQDATPTIVAAMHNSSKVLKICANNPSVQLSAHVGFYTVGSTSL